MIIIGFSKQTHMTLARLVCRRFKHCAIITTHGNKFILHQFVSPGNIPKIAITKRGITQLEYHGWVFIFLQDVKPQKINPHSRTCVRYAKNVFGIKNFWIQTPNALYKYVKKNLT